jgi:phosphoribosylformylglycinamidine cyclo-ligase
VPSLRYADAGVDVDEAQLVVGQIAKAVGRTYSDNVLAGVGPFAGLFKFDSDKYREPVLVSSTDSVGTKVKIAAATGRYRGIGIDIVNHCVNDIACCGAKPLFFLDYFASGNIDRDALLQVIEGASEACVSTGCALIGGETAEMPGIYAGNDFDIAGFVVGAVERSEIIDGGGITTGDIVLGLPSSGPHTNGYSLIRRIVADQGWDWDYIPPQLGRSLADAVLEPHRSYLQAIHVARSAMKVKGIAHITGGGIGGNLIRVLPNGLGAAINPACWPEPALFAMLTETGSVSHEEMFKTFNMGLGLLLVVDAAAVVPDLIDGTTVFQVGVINQSGEVVVS